MVAAGSLVYLSCVIKSLPPPEFTWLHNGYVVSEGVLSSSNTSRLTLAASHQVAGEYRCQATNSVSLETRVTGPIQMVVTGTLIIFLSGWLSAGRVYSCCLPLLIIAFR